MHHVMDPSRTLLYSKIPPLCFCHQMTLGNMLGNLSRQNDVSEIYTVYTNSDELLRLAEY